MSDDRVSMWAQATRSPTHDLVCPACGEQNSPVELTNQIHVIDSRGHTACNSCGHGGPIQHFKRTPQ